MTSNDTRYRLDELENSILLSRLGALVANANALTADLLSHIADVDRRGLHLAAGCSSMFVYCTDVLHFSEPMAYKYLCAARAARKERSLFVLIERGELHLSAVCLLAPHLDKPEASDLLIGSVHKTNREIERLIAAQFPRPDVEPVLRKLPSSTPFAVQPAAAPAINAGAQLESIPVAKPVARAARIEPLSSDRYKFQVTVSAAAHEKLRKAQALLRHQIPNGDLEKVLERALDTLIHDLERTKFAATDRPRKSMSDEGKKKTRHIPNAIKRQVTERDGGQCQFAAIDGRRCPERGFLEFHHLRPFARGGDHSVDNVALRCRAHNAYEAVLDYGEEHMHRASSGVWT